MATTPSAKAGPDGADGRRRVGRLLRRGGAGALVAVVGMAMLVWPTAHPASAASGLPSADATFTSLLNGLRGTLGLGTLSLDGELSGIARAWSVKMADAGATSHNPNLSTQAKGWSKFGENVAFGSVANQVFANLVASPIHMKNMSDPAFTKIGVGTVLDGKGVLWTTHVFIRPAGASAAPAPATVAPTSKAAPSASTKSATPTAAAAAATPAAATSVPTTVVAARPTPAPGPSPASAAQDNAQGRAGPSSDPLALPPVDPASSTRQQGTPFPVIVGSGLLLLLVLGGAGFLVRRSVTARSWR